MVIIVGALITGMFTLLAALIPDITKWWAAFRKRRAQVLLGISIVAVACVVMAIFLSRVITQSPQATITFPTGSSAAPATIGAGSIIEGRASDLSHDRLFLMLRSTEGGGLQYYPQAQVSDWTGANWRAALNALPGAGNYDLIAVAVTNPEASGELRMYIQICQTAATCPGVDTIPEGVVTLVSVPVIIP